MEDYINQSYDKFIKPLKIKRESSSNKRSQFQNSEFNSCIDFVIDGSAELNNEHIQKALDHKYRDWNDKDDDEK